MEVAAVAEAPRLIRPIALPNPTAYHMFPSGPAVMPNGYEPVVSVSPSVPSAETSPTSPRSFRVNQRSPPAGLVRDPGDPGVAGHRVLGDLARHRDLADVARIARELGEPEVPVRPGLDVPRQGAVGEHGEMRLVEWVVRIEPDDVVAELLGEPDVAVGTGGDPGRQLFRPTGYSKTVPFGRMTPTLLMFSSVNQSVPSGIAVIPHGCDCELRT